MNFTEPQLKKCYDRNFAAVTDLSSELRRVGALMAAHDLFRLIEGPHSPRVHETIEHLLLPGLRGELRHWYQRSGAAKDRAAIEFRDHLT